MRSVGACSRVVVNSAYLPPDQRFGSPIGNQPGHPGGARVAPALAAAPWRRWTGSRKSRSRLPRRRSLRSRRRRPRPQVRCRTAAWGVRRSAGRACSLRSCPRWRKARSWRVTVGRTRAARTGSATLTRSAVDCASSGMPLRRRRYDIGRLMLDALTS